MQPYFFPYLGYFDLINQTDKWLVFDVVNYQRKSWMNRNRVLHPDGGWAYITVPARKKKGESILRQADVVDAAKAESRILGQLHHYRKYAPYHDQVVDIVKRTFSNFNSVSLVNLNVSSLKEVCGYLGMVFDFSYCSKMDLDLPPITSPGQWALEISKILGVQHYINLPGGKSIFDEQDYVRCNVRLSFTKMVNFVYDCGPYPWLNNLSMLDVMMWNSPADIMSYLESHKRKGLG